MRDLDEFKGIRDLMLANSNAAWRVHNIGNNNPVLLMDYIAALEPAFGKKSRMKLLPLQPGDMPDTYTDIDDWIEKFLYKPATPLAIGVAKLVDWVVNHYRVHT